MDISTSNEISSKFLRNLDLAVKNTQMYRFQINKYHMKNLWRKKIAYSYSHMFLNFGT